MADLRAGDVVGFNYRAHGRGKVLRVQRGKVMYLCDAHVAVKAFGSAVVRRVDPDDVWPYVDAPEAARARSRQATKAYSEGLQSFILLHPDLLRVDANPWRAASTAPLVTYGGQSLSSSARTLCKKGFASFGRISQTANFRTLRVTDAGRRWLEEQVYAAAEDTRVGQAWLAAVDAAAEFLDRYGEC